jgi:hypothetical protein
VIFASTCKERCKMIRKVKWEIKRRSDVYVKLLCVSLFRMTMTFRPSYCTVLQRLNFLVLFTARPKFDLWQGIKKIHACFHQNITTYPTSLWKLSPEDIGDRTEKSCCWTRGILNRFICPNYMVVFNTGVFYRWLGWSFLVQLAAGCLELPMIFR